MPRKNIRWDWSRAAGFCTEASSSINFYRCYAIGNVQGEEASGFVFNWPGSINWQEGIFCVMEECFSTGTVTAKQNAVGLIYFTGAKIKNCYSTSDIYVLNQEGDTIYNVTAAGLVGVLAGGSIVNCYYSGEICVLAQNPDRSILIGAICADFASKGYPWTLPSIINCHWFKKDAEDGISYDTVGQDRSGGGVIDATAYNDIAEMCFLADTLNTDKDNPVWVNVTNSTPQLKFMTEGDDA